MSELKRCGWVGDDPLYQSYHDEEWGVPEYDSRALWEKLILDGFQAGLSWITILRKRENFQAAFDGFKPEIIVDYGEDRIEALLQDAGIIRHRGKIVATISNARAYLDIEDELGSFSDYLWQFTGGKVIENRWTNLSQVPAQTAESAAMSKDLKRRGFKFCGPTICYAFMQAVGMVNDHTSDCFRYRAVG